jgi:hypothetical protein
VIIVDASVLAIALGDDGRDGQRAYIALAEALDVVLITADVHLSRAPGVRCEVEAIS